MDRPGCHAHWRRVVSVYLVTLADVAPLPRVPGISTRAMRSALRMMCRIAQNDGTMRYGLRASKLAKLCEYSVATIHRAERALVEHGLVERVAVGGGRSSTRWRILVDKLTQLVPAPREPTAEHTDTESKNRPPRLSRWRSRRQHSTLVESICSEHGGDGGTLADGTPRCPQCRGRRGTLRRE